MSTIAHQHQNISRVAKVDKNTNIRSLHCPSMLHGHNGLPILFWKRNPLARHHATHLLLYEFIGTVTKISTLEYSCAFLNLRRKSAVFHKSFGIDQLFCNFLGVAVLYVSTLCLFSASSSIVVMFLYLPDSFLIGMPRKKAFRSTKVVSLRKHSHGM